MVLVEDAARALARPRINSNMVRLQGTSELANNDERPFRADNRRTLPGTMKMTPGERSDARWQMPDLAAGRPASSDVRAEAQLAASRLAPDDVRQVMLDAQLMQKKYLSSEKQQNNDYYDYYNKTTYDFDTTGSTCSWSRSNSDVISPLSEKFAGAVSAQRLHALNIDNRQQQMCLSVSRDEDADYIFATESLGNSCCIGGSIAGDKCDETEDMDEAFSSETHFHHNRLLITFDGVSRRVVVGCADAVALATDP